MKDQFSFVVFFIFSLSYLYLYLSFSFLLDVFFTALILFIFLVMSAGKKTISKRKKEEKDAKFLFSSFIFIPPIFL